jgi:hypothetical protein
MCPFARMIAEVGAYDALLMHLARANMRVLCASHASILHPPDPCLCHDGAGQGTTEPAPSPFDYTFDEGGPVV